MNPVWRALLSLGILAGFIAFVEIYFGWLKLLEPWTRVPVREIVVAAALIFTSYWLRALRFYDYFRSEMSGRFALCSKLMLQHNLLNNLLPMRTGELSFPILMTRYFAIPALRSMPALLWFRALDLHTLGTFGVLVLHKASLPWSLSVIVLVLWVPLPLLSFHFSTRWRHVLQRHEHRRIYKTLSRLLQGLPQAPGDFWHAWGWTLLNWMVKLGAFVWVLRLFIPISLPAAWMGCIMGDLTSVLPVHGLAGAGTYEAGVVAGLLPYGVAAQEALAAAVNLHLFLLGTTLMGGLISLFMGGQRRE